MSRTKRWLSFLLSAAMLFAPSLAPLSAAAQTKTKKPLKESDARRAIASMPGFALNTGAVKVREIAAGADSSALVRAEVETAIRFRKISDDDKDARDAAQQSPEKWRAVEFRSGDRSWEEFEWLEAIGGERIENARRLLGELASEFEAGELARLREKEAGRKAEIPDEAQVSRPLSKAEKKRRDKEAKREAERLAKEEEQRKAARESRRGAVRLKDFSPLLSSAVAVCFIEATFRLVKDAGGKWRVVEFTVEGASSGNLEQIAAAVNASKAERARAELETIKTALEAFRRERGFYPVVDDSTALIDHLSPRYLAHIIRIDPWHRPYRYEGATDRYIIRSDGADGVTGTADDVTLSA